jgi:hypothetical protein
MALPPLICVVCSDRHRNGKTLLARALTDYLLLEGRDPFCLDLSAPEGALRAFFPGRTALVNFAQMTGKMKVFDTILAGPGRDYIIDMPAERLARFCEAVSDLNFREAAAAQGFRSIVIFIVDAEAESLKAAAAVEDILQPDLFIPAANRFVGSALPDGVPGVTLTLEALPADLIPILSNRRFSLRNFILGDEANVPFRLRGSLKSFLATLMDGFRDIEPALSLLTLRD